MSRTKYKNDDTFEKVNAFKNSDISSVDKKTKKDYFNWLCPTKKEKAKFMGRYVASNPDDGGTVAMMADSFSDNEDDSFFDYLFTNREIDERVYNFSIMNIFVYLKEFGLDLAELFLRAVMMTWEELKINEPKKENDTDDDAIMNKIEYKEKPLKKKGHIGSEKYKNEEDRSLKGKIDYGQKACEDARLASYSSEVSERASGSGGWSIFDLFSGLFSKKESEPQFERNWD